MSYTEIFKFTPHRVKKIGEIQNSHRGAMRVWLILDEKYVPGFDYVHTRDIMKTWESVWDLFPGDALPEDERIVLGSTFDRFMVYKKDIPRLLKAFRSFVGNTSLSEQADIIEREYLSNRKLVAIAWNQCSVSEFLFKDYNVNTGDDHYNLFEQLVLQSKK